MKIYNVNLSNYLKWKIWEIITIYATYSSKYLTLPESEHDQLKLFWSSQIHPCMWVSDSKKKKIFSLFKRNVHWFVLINLPAWKDKFLAKTEEMISDQSIQSEMKTHKSKNQVENQSLCSLSRKRYPVSEKMSEEVDRYLFS